MGRVTKVIGFPVPPALAEEVEQVAKAARRTKSELFREMFRVYQCYRQQREQEEERWVIELIREAKLFSWPRDADTTCSFYALPRALSRQQGCWPRAPSES